MAEFGTELLEDFWPSQSQEPQLGSRNTISAPFGNGRRPHFAQAGNVSGAA